jgi:mannosyltransferase
MASGTPVVATRAGAAADLIVEGVTGRVVPPQDLEYLIAAIESLMAMGVSKRAEMGAAGRVHVVEHHSIENEAVAICEVYEELFARADGRVSAA